MFRTASSRLSSAATTHVSSSRFLKAGCSVLSLSSLSSSTTLRGKTVQAKTRKFFQKRQFGSGGDMPVPQSSYAQLWQGHPYREGWESTMTWWYGTSLLLLVAILGFAPNTDIESWARQEAQARLSASGSSHHHLFGTHSFNLVQENRDATWDKFSVKSVRMTEEDDDDEEEEDEEEEEEDDE